MKTLIFAAGYGTRLGQLTSERPKALVKVAGHPLLELLLDKLVAGNFTDIVINLHYRGDMIRRYIGEEYLPSREGRAGYQNLTIKFSDESDQMRGNGGGIKHAAPLLDDGEPFLVHNVDIVSDIDLQALYNEAIGASKEADAPLATLVVSKRKSTRRLLFDDTLRLVGWENIVTHEVKSPYLGIESANGKDFAHKEIVRMGLKSYPFAGIHVISPAVFGIMEKWDKVFSIIDFYLACAMQHRVQGKFIENLRMVDVGKLSHIHRAEELIRSMSML